MHTKKQASLSVACSGTASVSILLWAFTEAVIKIYKENHPIDNLRKNLTALLPFFTTKLFGTWVNTTYTIVVQCKQCISHLSAGRNYYCSMVHAISSTVCMCKGDSGVKLVAWNIKLERVHYKQQLILKCTSTPWQPFYTFFVCRSHVDEKKWMCLSLFVFFFISNAIQVLYVI